MNTIEILYIITLIAFFAYVIISETRFNRERQKLLDRIMAKDLTEYKSMQNTSVPKAVENPIRRKMKERGGWIDARKS